LAALLLLLLPHPAAAGVLLPQQLCGRICQQGVWGCR
jgi:hypothetical protein